MPKDYNLAVTPANQQRRPQNAQSDEWVREFLRRAHLGHLATRWDDQPFITPTTFWYDSNRHEIYFHSNIVGRVRANAERHDRVCFEASDFGKFLPSNIALEFSVQYESVVAFGLIRVLEELDEKRRALSGLIGKYFPALTAGIEYRPITDAELKRTSVYAIKIESWSGKRNWPDHAEQSDEWPPLGEEWVK
ncbi:MAG TPA: pyridoxamine 5'-phosphate oxidase family protein [Anaerolineales bacterium]|nr:pyridoxamine 5'-phosphate oxidase family protein [Anaerolineales bacterium]